MVLGAMLVVLDRLSGLVAPLFLGPLAFASILLITLASARFMDRRPLADLGLRLDLPRAADFGAGMLVGGASIGLVAVVEGAVGAASYATQAVDGTRVARMVFVAVFFVGVAIQEELVFRGYHLLNLTEGLTGARISAPRAAMLATLVSALGFGLAHAGNDGASILATVQVAVAGGTLLAVGYVLTGDLAYSIGLHFAWNFAQCALGMPVSGFVLSDAALLTRAPHGSELLTGGAFGPEASLIGLAAMLVGTALSLAYVRARYGPLGLRMRLVTPPRPSFSEPPSGAS